MINKKLILKVVRPTQPFPPRLAGPCQQQFPRATTPQPSQPAGQQQQQSTATYPNLPCSPALSGSPSGVSVSDQELQALLSQKDIATSLAEDLLKQFAQGAELDLDQSQPRSTPPAPVDPVANPPSNIRIATEPTPVLAYGGPMGRPSGPPRGIAAGLKGGPGGFAKMVEDTSDAEDDRLNNENGRPSESDKLKECNIQMTARQVLDSCKGNLFLLRGL